MTTPPKIVAGLCSVTFRQFEAERVLDVAAAAGLEAVEWGADVHLPPGNQTAAAALGARCVSAGIRCASYGSYYGVADEGDAKAVLDTAVAVGAANVRAWCPYGLGPDAAPEQRAAVAHRLSEFAAEAANRALTVSLEFHPGTLTQTAASTLALLKAVGASNLFTYWQPDPGLAVTDLHAELAAVVDHVSHLHVFRWEADGSRLPLSAGADLWPTALAAAAATGGRWQRERVAFLEFVRDDDPAQLGRDAATLRLWLEALG